MSRSWVQPIALGLMLLILTAACVAIGLELRLRYLHWTLGCTVVGWHCRFL